MRIIPGNAQHIGAREEQQDAFGFSNWDYAEVVGTRGVLSVLADGMGGMAMGGEASQAAVSTMLMEYQTLAHRGPVMELLRRALHQANAVVNQMAVDQGLENQVGTTLIATVIHDQHLFWVSVGDSRIYLYRHHQLIPLTEDHVYARRLDDEVAQGRMSKEEADNHPHRAALTSYLGLREIPEVDANVKPLPLYHGDKVLLCSDGLHGVLDEGEIIESLENDAQTASTMLLERVLAKRRKYQDNVTVAILACVDEQEREHGRSETQSAPAGKRILDHNNSQKSNTNARQDGESKSDYAEELSHHPSYAKAADEDLVDLKGRKRRQGIRFGNRLRLWWGVLFIVLAVVAVGGGYFTYQKWFRTNPAVVPVQPDGKQEGKTGSIPLHKQEAPLTPTAQTVPMPNQR
ncbi:PP2C family protein-serine/threonine phosphatase [Brevibacillus dissolubilis]|uniref:PP2C family protein-serine/threonine phosphatase n=1 Tax=Brevibacillus dissolubilis TaxID=1844116 RepID=UPI00111779D9|nr:protein phosphatase 2C domain-containing protein [Brevibacillus dissolubilis]